MAGYVLIFLQNQTETTNRTSKRLGKVARNTETTAPSRWLTSVSGGGPKAHVPRWDVAIIDRSETSSITALYDNNQQGNKIENKQTIR